MKLFLNIALAAALMLGAGAASAADLSKADIVGLKIGMSVAQAEEALKKHDPDLKIERHEIIFNYTDGAMGRFETPPIINRVSARRLPQQIKGRGDMDQIILAFYGKPGEEVLTAMVRKYAGNATPLSKAEFLKVLEKKYGAPTVPYSSSNLVKWTVDDATMDCFYMGTLSEISNHLMDMARNYTASDEVTKCEAGLTYGISEDPVTGFYASMTDKALIQSTDATVQEWVEALEAAEVKKREGNAQAPKL